MSRLKLDKSLNMNGGGGLKSQGELSTQRNKDCTCCSKQENNQTYKYYM